jgi:hypothetical protein
MSSGFELWRLYAECDRTRLVNGNDGARRNETDTQLGYELEYYHSR